VMTTESGNHEKLSRYITHIRARGIELLPPDVNESSRDFTVVPGGIRFGLAGIKNVGEGAIELILAARAGGGGPFESLSGFCEQVEGRKVNRRVVESLIKCGAFDSIHDNRAAVWAGLDAALESGAATQRDREIGQGSLFGGSSGDPLPTPTLPDIPAWTDRQQLEHEKQVLGFYVSGHPLSAVSEQLSRFVDVVSNDTKKFDGREVWAGGLLTSIRETRTRRGALMGFAELEDLEGVFDLVVFSEPHAQFGSLMKSAIEGTEETGPVPLLVSGTLEAGDPPKILVRQVLPLDRAEERLSKQLDVTVIADEATPDRLTALRDLLQSHRGECEVIVRLLIPGESETLMTLNGAPGVRASAALLADIDGLFGRRVTELST
jgi:DNA polymerase-3 subunit alpha